MSNQHLFRKRTFRLVSVLILSVIMLGSLITLLFSSLGQPNNSSTITSIIVTIFGAGFGVLGLSISVLGSPKRKSPKLGELREPTVTTGDISTRFRLQPTEETSDELLSVEKQRLELEKQKIQLEREQQTIGWQKEALEVVQVSPRSAIVIAWIGVEQELNHIARRSINLIRPGTNITQPFSTINALSEADYINQHELETLKRMQEVRNRVAHGIEESLPSTEEALNYIQDAINITQKLASIEE
jgi:hypothetical protein